MYKPVHEHLESRSNAGASERSSSRETSRPWYTFPWLWFVISIPAASIIAGIGLVIVAGMNADTVIDKDGWEKRGVLIAKPDSTNAAPETGDDGRD